MPLSSLGLFFLQCPHTLSGGTPAQPSTKSWQLFVDNLPKGPLRAVGGRRRGIRPSIGHAVGTVSSQKTCKQTRMEKCRRAVGSHLHDSFSLAHCFSYGISAGVLATCFRLAVVVVAAVRARKKVPLGQTCDTVPFSFGCIIGTKAISLAVAVGFRFPADASLPHSRLFPLRRRRLANHLTNNNLTCERGRNEAASTSALSAPSHDQGWATARVLALASLPQPPRGNG